MGQLGFYIDTTSCSGCKTCQVACKDKNDLHAGMLWRRVYEVSGGSWDQKPEGGWKHSTSTYNISLSCNHCEDPSCIKACPTKALGKAAENGLVLIDTNKCVGCRYCEWACPYGALQFNKESGIMSKCNFCSDYLEVGNLPSCVSACPMRVLEFGELSELRKKHGFVNKIHPIPDPEITKPALVIKPHAETKTAQSNNAVIANMEEVKND